MKKKLLAVLAVLFAASHASEAGTPYMNTFSIDNVVPNSAGWSYWFIPTGGAADSLNVKMTCVTEGEWLHGAHSHNHDELYVLVEGEGVVRLNEEEHFFKAGDGLYCPSGSYHSIRRTDFERPLKYLMINRNVPGGISEPFPFFKDGYHMSDCFSSSAGSRTFWHVTPRQTVGGLNVRSVNLKRRRTCMYPADGRQLVIVILDGTADISVDGTPVELSALSVCHVPKGAVCTLRSSSQNLRYLEVRNN